jgi:hypothetical protein
MRWDDTLLAEGVRRYGKDWAAIASFMGSSRTAGGVKWYYQRHRKRLGLDAIAADREAALTAGVEEVEEHGGWQGSGMWPGFLAAYVHVVWDVRAVFLRPWCWCWLLCWVPCSCCVQGLVEPADGMACQWPPLSHLGPLLGGQESLHLWPGKADMPC